MVSIIRSESHALVAPAAVRADIERTIAFYRRIVRMSATVAMTHWPELGSLKNKERMAALEALLHPTKDRPMVRYSVLSRAWGKMPSYLRRAALNAALGAVSSFLSNYSNWLDGEIGGKKRVIGSKPPRLGFSQVFPSLYGGNMILIGTKELPVKTRFKDRDGFIGPLQPRPKKRPQSVNQLAAYAAKVIVTPFGFVRIKLLSADGQWNFSEPLKFKGKLIRLKSPESMALSPTLILKGSKAKLSCPVEVKPPTYSKNDDFIERAKPFRVCSVDVGINTAATLAIVDSRGTVIARKFLLCARHNDQRDKLSERIATKQEQSGGTQKGKPFCSGLHRRIAGLSLDAARRLASEISLFAHAHKADLFVVEDLKGWRPKGPSKSQRKRFHRFQHRMLIKHLGFKAQELGMRMLEVYARGTSRWAYDGSGKVTRSKKNAQLAVFASGKQYNADLNGALNIAARGVAQILGLQSGPDHPNDQKMQIKAVIGKRSDAVMRMPLVLADIWTLTGVALSGSKEKRQVANGPSNRSSKAMGVCI